MKNQYEIHCVIPMQQPLDYFTYEITVEKSMGVMSSDNPIQLLAMLLDSINKEEIDIVNHYHILVDNNNKTVIKLS